ncbi:MAG: hypothetical protein K2X77_03535 [Candidatus Obscuribacterales bacterium]|jgi:hypothetical protein|nr:hypothetical protein [Candidatus Obscuribacterales bacterium]
MEMKGCACLDDKDSQDLLGTAANDDARDALDRMREDINNISVSDTFIKQEMNKVRVVCSPPPITPPCRIEELPPDPLTVTVNMRNLATAEKELQKELDELSPIAPALGKRFEQDVQIMDRQLDELDFEVKKLSELTDLTTKRRYDKHAIRMETELIEQLTRRIGMTHFQMINDLPR